MKKDLPAQHQEDQHDSSDRFTIRNFCESSETSEEKQELARQREENKVKSISLFIVTTVFRKLWKTSRLGGVMQEVTRGSFLNLMRF